MIDKSRVYYKVLRKTIGRGGLRSAVVGLSRGGGAHEELTC